MLQHRSLPSGGAPLASLSGISSCHRFPRSSLSQLASSGSPMEVAISSWTGFAQLGSFCPAWLHC